MKLQTKVTASVGILIGLTSMLISSVSIVTSLDQDLRQSEQTLEVLADLIADSQDPVSTALFESSNREISVRYTDAFGIETYLQEGAGEIGIGPQVTRVIEVAPSESITLAVSSGPAFATATASVFPLGVITLVVILIATLLVHLLLRSDISAINHLIQRAKVITEGGDREIIATQGSWEVETLSQSLKTMIEALDANEQALQKFLSDASHELKTPLTVVRGYLDILSQPSSPPEIRLNAERALRQSIRMQKIIDDLLRLAEIRSTEARFDAEFDLSELLSDAITDLGNLDSGHQIQTELATPLPIRGNLQQIQQLLANLMGNLHHHLPAGSRVFIKLWPEAGTAHLTIDDNGPGLPERILDANGQPTRFRKGNPEKSNSTGLGLSLVFEVVANHRGIITMSESDLGGLKTEIRLPLV